VLNGSYSPLWALQHEREETDVWWKWQSPVRLLLPVETLKTNILAFSYTTCKRIQRVSTIIVVGKEWVMRYQWIEGKISIYIYMAGRSMGNLESFAIE